MAGIHELAALVGVTAACVALGVPRSTYYRHTGHTPRPAATRRVARTRAR